MNVYMLLDRTGSMESIWSETLSSINAYVEKLATDKIDARVTLAMFDSHNGTQFDIIRKGAAPKDWKKVTPREASPRGYTPLYDAIGRLMSLATAEEPAKAAFVIITDGAENSSREISRDQASALLDSARRKGWDVIFLGADFDAFEQAAAVGTTPGQTLYIAPGYMAQAMAGPVAARARAMSAGGSAPEFSAADRKVASPFRDPLGSAGH